jgi:hypothetical protein
MTKLKCSIASINLPNGDPSDGRYYVQHNGIVREETFYGNVGKRCNYSPAMARAVGESIFEEISELLRRGYRIELPQMSVFISMHGKKAAEAKGNASIEMSPSVHLQPRGKLKECCRNAFNVEIVTQQASVVVSHFSDRNIQDGAIGDGTNVEVHITGTGLYMPNTSDPTVGVWIEDSSGKVAARATVMESANTSMTVQFPKIDLAPGDGYRLCVASRAKLTGAHSMRTVRRRLTILPETTMSTASPSTRSGRAKGKRAK